MKLFRSIGGGWRAPALCLFLLGCIEIVEPAPPDIDLGDAGGACPGTCSCSPTDVVNRAYRFSTLIVDQPAELKNSLDRQWASEIANYLTNIIFVVNSAEQDPASTAAFSKINLTAGPGWRLPSTPYQVDEGFEVQTFCMTDQTLNFTVDASPEPGAQCTFASEAPVDLFYHLGPKADPLMCAPLLTPSNSTPIMDLSFSFGFSQDCSGISTGYLSGCIPLEAAEKICTCIEAGRCGKNNAAPTTEFPADWESADPQSGPLVEYCKTACGTGDEAGVAWGSFQGMLLTFDVPTGGCEVNGAPGVPLSARFTAEAIPPEKFQAFVPGCSAE